MPSIVSFVKSLENFFFRFRVPTLAVLLVFTVAMGWLATKLHMTAGFDKQLPVGHEYIDTFFKYRTQLFGSNRIMVVVRAKKGDIWSTASLKKLHEVTEAVLFLPGVDRRSVQSLWTPNTRVYELTEEGFNAEDVIGGNITPDALDAEKISKIRDRVIRGGYTGNLVANDGTAAMVVADLLEEDPKTHQQLDYLALAEKLESEIRGKMETPDHAIEIIGFAKQIGDIAAGAKGVTAFFVLAILLTVAAVYWYCRSVLLTLLPILCSMTSVVWQFGALTLLGYGLDPLAILVPFLVFAIGVSHGVQQINAITKAVAEGQDSMGAARESFSSLFIPGTLALVTAFVGFITLVIIPIPMIRELGITASIGVGFKIVTNLIMLPVVASFFRFPRSYALHLEKVQEKRGLIIQKLGFIADINHARLVLAAAAILFGIAVWQSHGRHIGALQPGAPELRADSRYNQDVQNIVSRFDLGMDVLTVVFETPNDSCNSFPVVNYIDQFTLHMAQVPGVLSVSSLSALAKFANAGLNEGNPKLAALPRDSKALQVAVGYLPEAGGLFNRACTMMAANVYLADHKATSIKVAIDAVKEFRKTYPPDQLGMKVLLASGNVGVLAATNEEVEARELPMMLYVYAAIMILVLLAYRDWRAMLACCVPLTVATFLGYWFMKTLDIGLTVATLPVMVLATGIGVDYAFYIYNRLLIHLSRNESMKTALEGALREVGIATIFTAITLSVGVATWSFSDLKFQADMGILLTFMFMINMVMAITVLPAFAVKLDSLFPRKGPVKAPPSAIDEETLMTLRRIVACLLLSLPLFGSMKVGAGETAKAGAALSQAPVLAHPEKAAIIAATLAGQRIVAVGDYGVVILSDDGKNFRQAKSVPTRTVLTSVYFLNDKQGWAAGHDGTILTTSDGGENWQIQRAEPGKDRVLMSIWFENAQHGLAVGQFGLALETNDGGKTWQERRLVEGEAGERHLFQIFAGPDGLAFVAAEAGTLLRTSDGGRSWKAIQTDNKGSFWTGLVQKDGNVIVAGMRGHVYRSTDKGLTWTEIPSGTQQSITGILSHDHGDIHLYGNSGVLLLSSQDHVMSLKLLPRVDRSNITAAVRVKQGDRLFSLNGLLPEK